MVTHDPVKATENLKKHGVSRVAPQTESARHMKREYDFTKGKRGAVIPQTGKTRISIFIDNATLDAFRARALKAGTGYQTMMNEALRAFVTEDRQPVTEEVLRNVLRQEIPEYLRGTKAKRAKI